MPAFTYPFLSFSHPCQNYFNLSPHLPVTSIYCLYLFIYLRTYSLLHRNIFAFFRLEYSMLIVLCMNNSFEPVKFNSKFTLCFMIESSYRKIREKYIFLPEYVIIRAFSYVLVYSFRTCFDSFALRLTKKIYKKKLYKRDRRNDERTSVLYFFLEIYKHLYF